MSKNTLELKQAIQGLNITKPFDLRAQSKPALKRPAETEVPQVETVQTKPAQNREAQNGVSGPVAEREHGFFMLAHSVFENVVLRQLSGDSFRIFIWMSALAWRFRGSSGEFRASVEYVSAKCGCSRSTATRGLKDLRENQLIECVEQNFKKGNLWRVSRIADGRRYVDSDDAQDEQTKNEPTQEEDEVCSKSGSSSSNLSKEGALIEQQIITPKRFKTENNSLSEHDFLDRYLESLLAPKKRESESLALKGLLGTVPREQIRDAFLHLESKGFRFKEAQVHSPISFLAHAMGEVWQEVVAQKQKQRKPKGEATIVSFSVEETKMEAEGFRKEQAEMWVKFCNAYPDEFGREERLRHLLAGTTFSAKTEIGRAMGVMKWSES